MKHMIYVYILVLILTKWVNTNTVTTIIRYNVIMIILIFEPLQLIDNLEH